MHGNAINSCGPFSERLAPCACPNSRNKVQQRRCILNLGSVASAMLTASTGVSADAMDSDASGPAGMQVGLRGVKPEWHRCRIRDSGPRAFEVPDHVEWVRRIVLPCCLMRYYDGRRRGLLFGFSIQQAEGHWDGLSWRATLRPLGYPLPVEHWDYAPSCWGKRGGWLIDD